MVIFKDMGDKPLQKKKRKEKGIGFQSNSLPIIKGAWLDALDFRSR